MTKSNFPIVVLTQSDGSKLLNTLDHHGDSVLARLDAESDVDAIVEPTQTASIQTRQSPGTSRKKSDKESSGRWPWREMCIRLHPVHRCMNMTSIPCPVQLVIFKG